MRVFLFSDQTRRMLKVFKLSRGLDFSQSPAVSKPILNLCTFKG
jgi:hypothetical protein